MINREIIGKIFIYILKQLSFIKKQQDCGDDKMKKIIMILVLICLSSIVLAEDRSAGIVPELTAAEIEDAPLIIESGVYPSEGAPCAKYTYYAVYKDEDGREPEYIRIWLNGEWLEMEWLNDNPEVGGTVYVYYYIPTSGKPNLYYFEASNGAGIARGSIIDSPASGPVISSESVDEIECADMIQPEPLGAGGLPLQTTCGDGICEPPETEDICCEDCKAGGCENVPGLENCGDGVCEPPGETRDNCAEDCSPLGVINDEPMPNCGNGICEPPETQERCCDDCGGCMDQVKRAGDELSDETSNIASGGIKGFFRRIADFFRKLFRPKESGKYVIEGIDKGNKKVYVDGKEVPYKTEEELSEETKQGMRVIETGTGEKVYVENTEPSNTKTIIETTNKDGRVVENT
ncbi:MAG: hypothetical protein ABIH34_04265, partial [Nanoarchaeota archaeon]